MTKPQTDFWQMIEFEKFTDDRGDLIPIEFREKIPFEVKRAYFVTAKNGHSRGGHSHKIEEEVFIAVAGKITAKVNDKTRETSIILDSKTKGIYIKKNCWHEFFDFSEDAVLLAFSSTNYLPGKNNYITDFNEFLKS